MNAGLSQEPFWSERVGEDSGNYGLGLNLSQEEIAFQRKHLVANGSTLVLGATPALCTAALDISDAVTAVDFSEKVIVNAKQTIEHPGREEVNYQHDDWLTFLTKAAGEYDNIVTDGGLLCLEFPDTWEQVITQIKRSLRPAGIFAAKVYVYIPGQLPDTEKNPNLGRFMTIPTSEEEHWMVEPTQDIYRRHGVRYALPPREAVLHAVGGLTLIDEMEPNYAEAQRFLSFAWQKL